MCFALIDNSQAVLSYTLNTAFYVSDSGPGRGFPRSTGRPSEIYGLALIDFVVPHRVRSPRREEPEEVKCGTVKYEKRKSAK